MRQIKWAMLFVIIGSGLAFLVHALDIPLGGGGGTSGGGQKIGYVDMERIFQIYPETKFAKEDYSKRLLKKREALEVKEQQLESIKTRIAVLESTFKDLQTAQPAQDPVDGSTDPAAALSPDAQTNLTEPESLLRLKAELEEKRFELDEERKQAVQELRAFEKQQSQIILGKIYKALQDLAIEEQVTLVVDKSSILFGSAEIDLTEKLQERVRGF